MEIKSRTGGWHAKSEDLPLKPEDLTLDILDELDPTKGS